MSAKTYTHHCPYVTNEGTEAPTGKWADGWSMAGLHLELLWFSSPSCLPPGQRLSTLVIWCWPAAYINPGRRPLCWNPCHKCHNAVDATEQSHCIKWTHWCNNFCLFFFLQEWLEQSISWLTSSCPQKPGSLRLNYKRKTCPLQPIAWLFLYIKPGLSASIAFQGNRVKPCTPFTWVGFFGWFFFFRTCLQFLLSVIYFYLKVSKEMF